MTSCHMSGYSDATVVAAPSKHCTMCPQCAFHATQAGVADLMPLTWYKDGRKVSSSLTCGLRGYTG
jgi:hypothetical protein